MTRRVRMVVLSLLLVAPIGVAALQPPPAQGGFVQANDLPPTEQLPAAPLVVGAYTIFLVLMVGYVWSIARRLKTVEKEMRTLEHRQSHGGAAR